MVGADGLTPFRRLKGRKFGTPLAGFGERVWLRDPVLERVSKFNPRCTEARFKSSRHIVADTKGRFRVVRTIKRANADDRWKVGSPRDPFSAADLESTTAEFTCSRGTRGRGRSIPLHNVWRGTRLMLSRQIAHGTSDRCLGCRLVSGGGAQGHTEECRIRVEGESGRQSRGKLVFVPEPVEWVMLPQGVN